MPGADTRLLVSSFDNLALIILLYIDEWIDSLKFGAELVSNHWVGQLWKVAKPG